MEIVNEIVRVEISDDSIDIIGLAEQGPPGRDGKDGLLFGDLPDERVITANGTLEQEITPTVDFILLFENGLL
jgi:hypothetical protein